MSSPDTPTREQMDEFDAHKALANVLLAHQPRRSPLGDTLCACGMSFKAIDARAWHRHAAAMVENYLAALPPARPAEPTSEMRAKIITALEAADGWNPDAVSDDPRAHRAMVEEYERIADVVMGHLWPSAEAPMPTPSAPLAPPPHPVPPHTPGWNPAAVAAHLGREDAKLVSRIVKILDARNTPPVPDGPQPFGEREGYESFLRETARCILDVVASGQPAYRELSSGDTPCPAAQPEEAPLAWRETWEDGGGNSRTELVEKSLSRMGDAGDGWVCVGVEPLYAHPLPSDAPSGDTKVDADTRRVDWLEQYGKGLFLDPTKGWSCSTPDGDELVASTVREVIDDAMETK